MWDFIVRAPTIDVIWAALATLLALPGVLFVTWTTVPRQRLLSMVGGLIGDLFGLFVTIFVWGKALDSVHLEGAVVLSATFFIASVTGLAGAILVNVLLSGSEPRPRSSQVEY